MPVYSDLKTSVELFTAKEQSGGRLSFIGRNQRSRDFIQAFEKRLADTSIKTEETNSLELNDYEFRTLTRSYYANKDEMLLVDQWGGESLTLHTDNASNHMRLYDLQNDQAFQINYWPKSGPSKLHHFNIDFHAMTVALAEKEKLVALYADIVNGTFTPKPNTLKNKRSQLLPFQMPALEEPVFLGNRGDPPYFDF